MEFRGRSEFEDRIEPERVTRTFVRVRRGYDPPAVDAHLAVVREEVERLRGEIARGGDESLDLVLQATRRSIDDALTDAKARAEGILAEAETAADGIRAGARAEADRILAGARDRAEQHDAAAKERYLELGRLLEVRRTELESLDARIAQRQQILRRAAQDLRTLADGIPPGDDAGLSLPDGVEFHFPEQVTSEA